MIKPELFPVQTTLFINLVLLAHQQYWIRKLYACHKYLSHDCILQQAVIMDREIAWTPKHKTSHSRESMCLIFAILLLLLCGSLTLNADICTSLDFSDITNSTLGFGKMYAVSRHGSSRREALLRAAKLTSLDITIPVQPNWTNTDIHNLKAAENSTLDKGSALAWLGHLNALKQFLTDGGDTALILEDDVDFDTHIRTQQIPQTAYAIRELVDSQQGYYGATEKWDLIWLGHCGDSFSPSRGSELAKIKGYSDPTMPVSRDLHPWTRSFMEDIGALSQQRLVHESVSPLCSFAYSVTRHAAQRIVNELAHREPIRSAEHPCKAFDVRLLESCRDHGLRCITVNPELFHHSGVNSEISLVSQGVIKEESTTETAIQTPNIRCSARSRKWQQLEDSLGDARSASEIVKDLASKSLGCELDRL